MNLNQRYYKKTQVGIDAISLIFSLLLSVFIKEEAFIFPKTFADFAFIALLLLLWFLSANECRLYRNRIYKKFPEEILFNIYANILFIVFLSSFLFLTKSTYANLFKFTSFIGLHLIISIAAKYFIRKKQHLAFAGGALSDNIIIVGYNSNSLDFYKTLNEHVYYGYKCVGFINDQVIDDQQINYLGNLSNLVNVFKQQPIDEVIISLPAEKQNEIRNCIDICDQRNVRVRIMPNLQDLTTKTEEFDNLGLVSVINLNELPLDKFENKVFKNLFDIIFSLLFFIVVGWWLLPIIGFLVFIDSRGKVIYKQERWGVNNKPIICYKFRTMQVSEAAVDFQQTSRNDPRVTTLGKFLRKFSLDELPQFWNVLKGEMSVVGPRPHPTPMNLASMERVDNYLKRHIIKPGITGWAQINGCRGEVKTHAEMEQRVNFDLYYIHRWSFTLDMQIILQTIIKMLRDQGAY